jgi:hypothetical protein
MPAARAQVFTAVTEAGAAAPLSHAVAAEGAVLCQPPRRGASLLPVGDPARQATAGKTCDWVRRRFR